MLLTHSLSSSCINHVLIFVFNILLLNMLLFNMFFIKGREIHIQLRSNFSFATFYNGVFGLDYLFWVF